MKAVVLAGGYGTRLRPLTYLRPKAMLPIGPKPVLQYIIESLAKQGFDEIIVTTNYLGEQIERYFGDGSRFGVTLRYPREDRPLGTAGSVKNAEKFLDETFAVIQGDNITDISMVKQLKYHKRKSALATLSGYRVENPWMYGVIKVDRYRRVTGFQEKPSPEECQSKLINTGLYTFEPNVLGLIPKTEPFDFAKDLFPMILGMGKPMLCYEAKGFWMDVGNAEGFIEASTWLMKKLGRSISPSADVGRATIKGPVWIGDEATIETGVRIQGPVYIEESCKVRKNSLITQGTILKRSVSVGELSILHSAVVFDFTRIGSKVELNKCILDEKCEVGSNTKIDPSAIIGAGCKIGERVIIGPGVILAPGSTVDQGKIIRT